MKKSFLIVLFFVLVFAGSSVALNAITVPGDWTMYYSWGCDTYYRSVTLDFNSDGTFESSSGLTGTWEEEDGCLISWRYDDAPNTVYSGTKVGKAMTGMMRTQGATIYTGCWYAVKSVTSIAQPIYPKNENGVVAAASTGKD